MPKINPQDSSMEEIIAVFMAVSEENRNFSSECEKRSRNKDLPDDRRLIYYMIGQQAETLATICSGFSVLIYIIGKKTEDE